MNTVYSTSNDFHYAFHPYELLLLKWRKPQESFNFYYKDTDGNEQKRIWKKGESLFMGKDKIIYKTTFNGIGIEVKEYLEFKK